MTHSRLLASLFLLPACLQAQAGDRSADRGDAAGTPWTRAFGLTRVDGALHAAGPTYAAAITAAGIEFMPAFGPTADRPYTVALQFASVRRGDELVYQRAAAGAEPREEGLLIRIPHGHDIEERFEVQREGVEHSFVFARPLPGNGDLVVRLRLDTDLAPSQAGDEIRFEKAGLGGVTIGAVTGIDAAGRRCPGSLHYGAGCLEYRLPASFVDTARYPLVLDPVIGAVFTVLPTGSDVITDVDVAFDATSGVYLVVWARGQAAGASQIQGQRVSAAGALVGGLITIHPAGGSEIIANPAVASVNALDRFIVVYERTPPAADVEVRARTVAAANGAVSTTSTLVSALGTAAKNPDIGGRSAATGTTALVVWEGLAGSTIQGRVVSLSGTPAPTPPSLVGSEVTVATQAGFDERRPSVSRHEGAAGNYLVVWEREVVGRVFVGGRVVSHSGVLLSPMTTITPGTDPSESAPDCASADGTSFLVVYQYSDFSSIACKPATFAAAAGTLTVGAELEIERAFAVPPSIAGLGAPAVDFADTRYLVAYDGTVHTPLGTGPGTLVTSIHLAEVAPSECISLIGKATIASGTVTTTSTSISGSGVSVPAVCATFSGDRTLANDESLIPWVHRAVTSTGLPPQPTTRRGVNARRAEAIGQGGPVTSLGPACGGGGTAGVNGPVAMGNHRFAFTLTGMPAGTSATLFNLNVPVSLLGCGACQILPFSIVIPVAASAGTASLPLPIPCSASLVNGTVAVQWTVLANPTSPCPLLPQLAFSNALSVTIGR